MLTFQFNFEKKLRLFFLATVLTVFLLFISSFFIFVSVTRTQTNVISDHVEHVMRFQEIQILFERMVAKIRLYILSGDVQIIEELSALRSQFLSGLENQKWQFKSARESQLYADIRETTQQYFKDMDHVVGLRKDSQSAKKASAFLVERAEIIFKSRDVMQAAAFNEIQQFNDAEADAKKTRSWGLVFLAGIGLFSLLSGATLYWLFSRGLLQKRKIEKALSLSETVSRQAVSVAGLGVFDHDQKINTINWTPEMRKICGWDATEPVVLAAFIERIPVEERKAIAAAIRHAHDPTGNGVYDVEHRFIRRDGSVRWLRTKSLTFFEGDGANRIPVRTIGAVLDTTTSKAMELSLRKLTDDLAKEKLKLERSNRELEQFASVAAHDLRSPLTSMLGWVGMLNHLVPKPRDGKIDQAIEFIGSNAKKADALIGDLLEVARVNVSDSKIESVDLNKSVSNLLAVHMQLIEEARARIHVEALPTVTGCPSQLESLFGNLIRNAITYRDKTRTPEISIGCRQESEMYEFFVRDNGIGIEPEYTDRIFDMFKRLHSEKEFSGTGIGLAYCKKVVELHGGKIWVNSVPDEGSTFYFTYPVNYGGRGKA